MGRGFGLGRKRGVRIRVGSAARNRMRYRVETWSPPNAGPANPQPLRQPRRARQVSLRGRLVLGVLMRGFGCAWLRFEPPITPGIEGGKAPPSLCSAGGLQNSRQPCGVRREAGAPRRFQTLLPRRSTHRSPGIASPARAWDFRARVTRDVQPRLAGSSNRTPMEPDPRRAGGDGTSWDVPAA